MQNKDENVLFMIDEDKRKRIVLDLHKRFPKDAVSGNFKHYIFYKGKHMEPGDFICMATKMDHAIPFFYLADAVDMKNKNGWEFIIVRKLKSAPVEESDKYMCCVGEDSVSKEKMDDNNTTITFKIDGIVIEYFVQYNRIYIPILEEGVDAFVESTVDGAKTHGTIVNKNVVKIHSRLLHFLKDNDWAIMAYKNKLYALPVESLKSNVTLNTNPKIGSLCSLPVSVLKDFECPPF